MSKQITGYNPPSGKIERKQVVIRGGQYKEAGTGKPVIPQYQTSSKAK